MEIILAARRKCPVCKREMLIDNGRAVKLSAESEKKPPKQIRSRISKEKKWSSSGERKANQLCCHVMPPDPERIYAAQYDGSLFHRAPVPAGVC